MVQTCPGLLKRGFSRQLKFRALAQERVRILEHQFVDGIAGMAASAHLKSGFGYGERITDAPIAGAIHPDAFVAVHFDDVNSASGRAFGLGIKCHASPHASVEHQLDCVLFDVIDNHALGPNALVALDHVQN